jgi:hypothetical protein
MDASSVASLLHPGEDEGYPAGYLSDTDLYEAGAQLGGPGNT